MKSQPPRTAAACLRLSDSQFLSTSMVTAALRLQA
ncbi:hypothetical protein A2U01_0069238, partial [Trifolium medium]|nr:hypothetical protein [Trifolium medium]